MFGFGGLVERAIEVARAERAVLLVADDEGVLIPLLACARSGKLDPADALVSRALAARVLATQKPLVVEDEVVQTDPRAPRDPRLVAAVPVERVPFRGVLLVDKPARGAFSREELDALRELGAPPRPAPPAPPLVKPGFPRLVGESRAWKDLLSVVERAAGTSLPVLIVGEIGSGKSEVARTIHERSSSASGPFVEVLATGLGPELFDAELLGAPGRPGAIARAKGGTLYVDEVADLDARAQAKLLSLLDARLGFRIIAGTWQDLHGMVRRGEFRADLFYRLQVIPIAVPALRERGRDVLVLARHFLGRSFTLSRDAEELLLAQPWGCNVRELALTMEYAAAVLGAKGTVTSRVLAPRFGGAPTTRVQILAALEAAGWVVARAARSLGLNRRTLYRKLETLRIGLPDGRFRRPQLKRA